MAFAENEILGGHDRQVADRVLAQVVLCAESVAYDVHDRVGVREGVGREDHRPNRYVVAGSAPSTVNAPAKKSSMERFSCLRLLNYQPAKVGPERCDVAAGCGRGVQRPGDDLDEHWIALVGDDHVRRSYSRSSSGRRPTRSFTGRCSSRRPWSTRPTPP
jgi:hypothetical protein